MLGFSLRSLWNRRFVAGLTVLAISLSVALILGVERIRGGARDSFANSASGIDLVVAPRGNSVQILMATVFGVGGTGTGMTWESFKWLEDRPEVAWAVPIQMGDNHRGYPVIGTDASYFEHFRHSGGQPLSLAAGTFYTGDGADAAVIGAEVAARFGYAPGAVIVNAHGSGEVSFDLHDDAPFTISGVLAPTGTAVDRMVFVTLEGFDTLHAQEDAPLAAPLDPAAMPADGHGEDDAHDDHDDHEDHGDHEGTEVGHGHEPDRINAVYIGLIDRTSVLGLQRAVNQRPSDALSAVLPAVALAELWGITGTAERAMRLMAWAVALAGMIGMVVMLSATLETRRREFAILRSVGATPTRIFTLIVTEAAVLTAAGLILGLALLTVATFVTDPILSARFGLRLGWNVFGARELTTHFVIFCAGLLASLVPAVRVYRMTLADGLSVRL
ncbi:ABC transporter permease [Tropicimonas sediminicola]|uniref:Putative ABC transport system permease protein n=1 Tax=Tropicimonas sediminicola TaxID=1031541 RepID=A0A239FJH3_9RHOB|nr:ABC transporter permease [Tropicimonas sediminicola]SNS56955.1 putative ABC transport system permease protein [Tropicimonas sediminicola]